MKVTIITATYNNETTIADTIYAVANQTYKNIEHIVIDGKSTDKTLSIVNQLNTTISKIISEADNGIYDALNKGIKNATGNLIGFLHADDIYADNTIIEKIVTKITESQADSLYGDLQYVAKDNPTKIIRNWKSGEYNSKKLKKGWMPPHPTFFVKKHIYDKFGTFDTSFHISADYDTVLRFLGKYNIPTTYLPEIIVKMRIGGASNKSIKNVIIKMKEDVRALKKNEMKGWKTVFMKNFSKIPQFFSK